MSRKVRKIWLGLGAAALVTSPLAAVATGGHAGHQGHGVMVAAQASEAGEGGGEGEGGADAKAYDAKLPKNLRFARDIALIRGHLLVGDELVREGRWAEALPHFLHPSEEIYGNIRDDLKSYGVPPFLAALKALAQTVKAKNEGAYRAARANLEERLAAADKGVRAKETDQAAFAVDTVLEVLRVATNEYEGALKDKRIAKPVEYQDSRGFVWYAETLFSGAAEDLTKKDADAVKAAQAAFAELKKAWPTAVPPKTAVKDVGAVLSDVSAIELQIGRFK